MAKSKRGEASSGKLSSRLAYHVDEAPPQPQKPRPTLAELEARYEGDAMQEARKAGLGERLCGTTRRQEMQKLGGGFEPVYFIAYHFPRGTVHWCSTQPHVFDVTKNEANA